MSECTRVTLSFFPSVHNRVAWSSTSQVCFRQRSEVRGQSCECPWLVPLYNFTLWRATRKLVWQCMLRTALPTSKGALKWFSFLKKTMYPDNSLLKNTVSIHSNIHLANPCLLSIPGFWNEKQKLMVWKHAEKFKCSHIFPLCSKHLGFYTIALLNITQNIK